MRFMTELTPFKQLSTQQSSSTSERRSRIELECVRMFTLKKLIALYGTVRREHGKRRMHKSANKQVMGGGAPFSALVMGVELANV